MSKIKDKSDISVLIETLIPEFISNEHPKFKKFIEKYYEFMESHQVYFEDINFDEYKLIPEDEQFEYFIFEDEPNNKLYINGDANEFFDPRFADDEIINHRFQLEGIRDASKDDQLQFEIGETVTGNATGATAVVTGINSNTTAFIKPTTNTSFIYGEELTGESSRAWSTFANGVVAGVFPEGSIEGFRSRGPIAAVKELSEIQDIDRTPEGLIDDSWKKEFYTHIPKQTKTDRRKLLKQMIEVYRTKGGEASFEWLFKAVFNNQDVDFYYPKADLMRLSDGRWVVDKTVKIRTDTANNIQLFEGKTITGLTSRATGIVEKTITKMVGQVQITELFLSKIVKGVDDTGTLGYFQTYEAVETPPDANNEIARGFCSGIISDVIINYGGSNYEIDDELLFQGGGGAEAKAKVTELKDDVLSGFRIVDSGDGYFVGDKLDFIDGGTGGAGAAATVGTIIPTGSVLKNSDLIETVKTQEISANNEVSPLYANSSLVFSATIKENSGEFFDSSGSFFTTEFFAIGDILKKQIHINGSQLLSTLTQTGTVINLSNDLTVDEVSHAVGGKLTYANGTNTIITGYTNTSSLFVKDSRNISASQTFDIYYGDDSVTATVIGANAEMVLYSVSSYKFDENFGTFSIGNFSNNDTVILYDTAHTLLWSPTNSNGSDAAITHSGHTFEVGNTPANVVSSTFPIGDAFSSSGGYAANEVITDYSVTGLLTMTEHSFGAINSLAITSGGGYYKRLPVVTVANNFMISLSNSLEHTGANNTLINVNLHSYTTGTIEQTGDVLILTGGEFPDANSGLLHISYENGDEVQINSVINSTALIMNSVKTISVPETYVLTYQANANTFPKSALIYNEDYTARARVLDFIDEASKYSFPRSVGTELEGTYVEKPGQTGYRRHVIEHGNTTLRVSMLSTGDFSPVKSFLLADGTGNEDGIFDKIVFEDGAYIYPENSVNFVLMEDFSSILDEDGFRVYTEDVSSDRITAHDGVNFVTYSTGTISQSGNTITKNDGTFPNELVRGSLTYANGDTTTITGYTNATSITVDNSTTISTEETYSIIYNTTLTHGDVRSINALSSGIGNRTITITDIGHPVSSSDKIKISGASYDIFNGTFPVSYVDTNTYNYTLPEDTIYGNLGNNATSQLVITSWTDTSNASVVDTSLKGNNAIVEVSSISVGAIKAVDVYDVGAGYSSSPTVTCPAGNNNAILETVRGALAQYPGEYKGTQGRLDDAPKIQDSRYYQAFSYVIKSNVDTTKYRADVDRLLHPAGMKMFGELAINLYASVEFFKSGEHGHVDERDVRRPKYLQLNTPRFHPIILTTNSYANLISTSVLAPEIEIFTADAPTHAIDARLEVDDDVNLLQEDLRDVSVTRTVSTVLNFTMGSGTGTYELDEIVYQGASYFTATVTALVSGWDSSEKILTLYNQSGNFNLSKDIVGYGSTSVYAIDYETVLPAATITEYGHSMVVGDEIQITKATEDFWNGKYKIQTTPTTNTYTVTLYRGDPGIGEEATAQTAYGNGWIKVETLSLANVWLGNTVNWNSPYNGNILDELDGEKILLESYNTFLYPKIQFPEADSGTISIDMSFNSDILLEDHINPDTAMHETGYLLDEQSGSMGFGPSRYISLEEDTDGIEWSYERGFAGHMIQSIPYMESTIISTPLDSVRAGFSMENDRGNIVGEDADPGEGIPATRFIIEHSPVQEHFAEIEYELFVPTDWRMLLEDGVTRVRNQDGTLMLTEESIIKDNIGEYEFNLYENSGYNLKLENEDHLIEEGDETGNPLSRFLIEEDQLIDSKFLTEVEIGLTESMAYHLIMEDNSHIIKEGDETAEVLARLITEEGHIKRWWGEIEYVFDIHPDFSVGSALQHFHLENGEPLIDENGEELTTEKTWRPLGEVEFDLVDSIGHHLMMEDDVTHHIYEDDTRTLTEEIQLKRNYGEIEFEIVEQTGWHLMMEDDVTHHIYEDDTRALTEEGLIKSSTREIEYVFDANLQSQMVSAISHLPSTGDIINLGWNLLFEDENLMLQESRNVSNTYILTEQIYPAVEESPPPTIIDKSGFYAHNPALTLTASRIGSEPIFHHKDRRINYSSWGLQVGRPRGPAHQYPVGKFSNHRTLSGGDDVYDQTTGQAGSISYGPGINMNNPDRIGDFNQYWEIISDHRAFMLTGERWHRNIKTSVNLFPTPLVLENGESVDLEDGSGHVLLTGMGEQYRRIEYPVSPIINLSIDSSDITPVTIRPIIQRGEILRLETDHDGYLISEQEDNYFLLSTEFAAIRAIHSNFTTFNSLMGQISISHNATTVTGTNTLFQSQLSIGDVIQTFDESVLLEDDEDIVMESDERIQHEDIQITDIEEDYLNLGFYENIVMGDLKWFISTEESNSHNNNYYPGTGHRDKYDTPGSFYLVGETSLSEAEIELETGDGLTGVLLGENIFESDDILLEDNFGKMLMTDPGEFKISAITNDSELTVTRKHWGGTGDVPFWKQTVEEETTAAVSYR